MADENTDPPKKKSPIMFILAGVFGGLILVGGGLGAGYFLFGGSQPLPEELAEEIIASIRQPLRPLRAVSLRRKRFV